MAHSGVFGVLTVNEKHKGKRLSMEEGAALLGAEQPEAISNVFLDPIGMRAIATRIGQRLVSKGGRPTDASWDVQRKVPMKAATWDRLKELAGKLAERGHLRVAPGQLAACALERGLPHLTEIDERDLASVSGEDGDQRFGFHEESKEEAGVLCGVIAEERFW